MWHHKYFHTYNKAFEGGHLDVIDWMYQFEEDDSHVFRRLVKIQCVPEGLKEYLLQLGVPERVYQEVCERAQSHERSNIPPYPKKHKSARSVIERVYYALSIVDLLE